MEPKTARYVANALAVFAVVLCVLVWIFSGVFVLYWIIVGLLILCILASTAVVLFWYKCPHCNTRLPIRAGNIDYCPYCGEKLD